MLAVLCSLGLVSALGYYELSRSTRDNAAIRIDRAARAAVAILCHGTRDTFVPEFADDGHPTALRIAAASADDVMQPSDRLTGLMRAIGRSNQGAANLFSWSQDTASFDRFATTFVAPDGGPAPAFSITQGHPAFDTLSKGRPFIGNVPVQGRLRLAYLTPVLTGAGDLAGALAVDVGWVDDLLLAETRLKTRIMSAGIVVMMAVVLLGALLLRFELRPLRQLARTADDLASGQKPEEIPHQERSDEIGDLAHGLEKVRELQDRLHTLAYTDPITGGGNRARYFADLAATLDRARLSGTSAALVHIDFNGFAKVNDAFGQQVGNAVLRQAHERLSAIFGPQARIARISADDFCILLPHDRGGDIACDCATRSIAALSEPIQIRQADVRLDPSIGVALLPQDAGDSETAHRVAGLALRAAKDRDGTRIEFFSPPLNERVQTEMMTETLLRAALKTGQLTLHYQPQISGTDGALVGLEALIRWPCGERGFISPAEFIPLAERTGLILDLGRYVLEAACAQASAWRRSGFDFRQVSVNVSPLQFRQPSFADDVKQILADHDLPAGLLCLEVTENVFVDTSEQKVLDILSELGAIGVQLSLDDFGSGYSSLSYLHTLPFRELKIDRAFLAGADGHPQRAQLFQAIVGLGRSLGLRVIAEGAETAAEFALAARQGCDGIQGFYCSGAVPPRELPARLATFHASLWPEVEAGLGKSAKLRA